MGLNASIKAILSGYAAARKEDYADHPVAVLVRGEFARSIRAAISDAEKYKVKASAGITKWADSPWGAVFNPSITKSAEDGYYPVYLFRTDLSGAYLSLNQGQKSVRDEYGGKARGILRARAAYARAQLDGQRDRFPLDKIKLTDEGTGRASFYEDGNMVARFYPRDAIPGDEDLEADLQAMVTLYDVLVARPDTPSNSSIKQDDDETPSQYSKREDLRKYRLHRKLDRNRGLAREAKRIQGFTCKACEVSFGRMYGEIGEGYIEAHHLVPISTLKGQVVELDPAKDFVVLCSNCHRMIHRTDDTSNVEGLKARIQSRRG